MPPAMHVTVGVVPFLKRARPRCCVWLVMADGHSGGESRMYAASRPGGRRAREGGQLHRHHSRVVISFPPPVIICFLH